MNKTQQSAYHNILQGFQHMADEIMIPRLEPEELYNVFFQLRLDHPEIFWATGFRYKYYQDSPNLIFVPEYLFEKNKVKEHQRAMQARVEKLVRPVKDKSEWEKEKFVHDFICENVRPWVSPVLLWQLSSVSVSLLSLPLPAITNSIPRLRSIFRDFVRISKSSERSMRSVFLRSSCSLSAL